MLLLVRKILKVILYVLLQELCPKGEIFHCVIICEESVEVSDEILSVELYFMVEVYLRQKFQVSVHVHLNICNSGFIKKLDQMSVLMEVSSALKEIVHRESVGTQANFV